MRRNKDEAVSYDPVPSISHSQILRPEAGFRLLRETRPQCNVEGDGYCADTRFGPR